MTECSTYRDPDGIRGREWRCVILDDGGIKHYGVGRTSEEASARAIQAHKDYRAAFSRNEAMLDMIPRHLYYPGLAVGGPKAGMCLVHDDRRIRVPVQPVLGRYQGDVVRLEKADTTEFYYAWVRALEGGFNLNFWIPEDKEIGWAFEQLAKAYITEKTNGNR